MQITNLGKWTAYQPDPVPQIPGAGELPLGVVFARNAAGDDWYVYRTTWPADTLAAVVFPAADGLTGQIGAVAANAMELPVPIGLHVLAITDPTPGDVLTGMVVTFATGALAPAPVASAKTAKADIWRRMTADEAKVIYADLQAQDPRTRAIYEAAQYIDHSDSLFPLLEGAITSRLGADRAAEILAPS